MKKTLLAAALLASSGAANAITVPSFNVSPGFSSGPVTVVVAGFSPVDVFYELNVTANSLVNISLGSATPGPITYTFFNDIDSSPNQVTTGSQVGSAMQLATVGASFTQKLWAGHYVLKLLQPVTLAAGSSFQFISASTPSPVPLPGAALLFGTALFGAGALSRRKKAANQGNPLA